MTGGLATEHPVGEAQHETRFLSTESCSKREDHLASYESERMIRRPWFNSTLGGKGQHLILLGGSPSGSDRMLSTDYEDYKTSAN